MAETVDRPAKATPSEGSPAPQITNLGREIAQWVGALRGWKQAVAEACARGAPGPAEVDALFQRFLGEQGLLTPAASASPTAPHPPASTAAPSPSVPTPTVHRVKTIEHVSGVNKLPPGTSLEIGADTNLSIVYGPNGAGKSGFFRILKASCFTRTSGDRTVLGDVWAAAPIAKRAVVTVTKDGGGELRVKWEEGTEEPLLRDRIAVFDSTSVRAHLDEKNSLVFAPAGLDLFTRMATVFGQLKTRLEHEVKQRTPSLKIAVEGKSRVAELLATLGPTSPLDELKRLAVFGEPEAGELEKIEADLHELERVNPAEARARAETKLKRLSAVKEALERAATDLSDALLARLRAAREKISILERKAEIASAAQFSTDPVQPVGTRAWLELIAAATRYASEAYPGAKYPSGREGERCVLCHQTLAPDAADRMKRFWAATDTRVRQDITGAQRELQQLLDAISRVDLAPLSPESSSVAALESAGDLTIRVAAVHDALLKRKEAARAVDPAEMTAIPSSAGIIEEVSRLIEETRTELVRRSADAQDQARIVTEMQEKRTLLQHRRSLAPMMADVDLAIRNHRWVAAASKALSSLRTNELSTKQRALMEQLLKSDYAKRLVDECKELGFALPVEIHLAGLSGQTVRTVHLTGAGVRASPTQVLSEGEQRALALADFLTEVTVASEFECLVFDDPVTSHDHERKQRVAVRLVSEATERQVVIFTHDRVFIAHLIAAAKAARVPATCRTIGRRPIDDAPGFPGVTVFPEPYYEKQALNDAERLLKEARQLEGIAQQDKVLRGFGRLRTAYEEFIQKDMFGGVVNRWVEQVKWMDLHNAFFDPETVQVIKARLEGLSRHIDGHSHSERFQEAQPTVAELEREIAAFKKTDQEHGAKKRAFVAAAPKGGLLR